MKRVILLFICTVFYVGTSWSQTTGQTAGRMEASWNPGSYIATKPAQKGETKGTEFLNDEWYIGNITLPTGEINGYPIKYDLLHYRLEISTADGIKLVYYKDIKKFDWYDIGENKKRYFVSGDSFNIDGVKAEGIYEAVYDASPGLYKKTELKIKEATYIPTHNAGSQEDEYVQDETVFIEVNGELHPANSKKQIMEIFGDSKDQIKAYMKENKLSLKEQDDLILVLQYWSSSANQ